MCINILGENKRNMATADNSSAKKVTFHEKHARHCPVCDNEFYHEQILSGGGRLIAGELRRDLRRLYETTKKYGDVYPLIYGIVVCPSCLYASLSEDFDNINKKRIEDCLSDKDSRDKFVKEIFGYNTNFSEDRTLNSGAASYFLAINSYHYHGKETFPTFKKALCSLRLSWVLEDLNKVQPEDNYDNLIPFFQFKAKEFYNAAVEIMNQGGENFEALKTFGPDMDKNWGFEGMLYVAALLENTFSFFIEDPETRAEQLLAAKRKLGKLFGSGKSSKSKPSALLESVKELRSEINEELQKLSEQTGVEYK